MSVKETNKIIAEFMNLAKEPSEKNFEAFYSYEDGQSVGGQYYSADELKYHISWDWLMSVVERIENLSTYSVMGIKCINSFTIDRKSIEFYFNPNQSYQLHLKVVPKVNVSTYKHPMYKHHLFIEYIGTRIEIVYKGVVEFIKWYNEEQN